MSVFAHRKDLAAVHERMHLLAGRVQIEQPTMAQTLARMERDGLIDRQPDPGDKRSSLVGLTPAAREKLPQARDVLLEATADRRKL